MGLATESGRTYDQHCGLAHALDLVGERWTLLSVRELLAGPRRYTDLAAGLVSVPSNVLATRLREMESRGLVWREKFFFPQRVCAGERGMPAKRDFDRRSEPSK